ncbi:hypothetical protein [Lentilactobacillus otakiensis]|uniref:hypothetical protein n=1 Tax=Lentilactobacillus otakiensis TaxID=481720 RepID=UPI003D170E19
MERTSGSAINISPIIEKRVISATNTPTIITAIKDIVVPGMTMLLMGADVKRFLANFQVVK